MNSKPAQSFTARPTGLVYWTGGTCSRCVYRSCRAGQPCARTTSGIASHVKASESQCCRRSLALPPLTRRLSDSHSSSPLTRYLSHSFSLLLKLSLSGLSHSLFLSLVSISRPARSLFFSHSLTLSLPHSVSLSLVFSPAPPSVAPSLSGLSHCLAHSLPLSLVISLISRSLP